MDWREGFRTGHPADACPGCGASRPIFAADFKKFGKHSVRACGTCLQVFVDGDLAGKLETTPKVELP